MQRQRQHKRACQGVTSLHASAAAPLKALTIVHYQQRALRHQGGCIPHFERGAAQAHRLAGHLGRLRGGQGEGQKHHLSPHAQENIK